MYHTRHKGTHYQAGFRFGSILKKNGINPLDHVVISKKKEDFAKKCLPVYVQVYPNIIEEIKGMSEAMQIDYKKMCNFLLTMYALTFDNNCSCFAFRKDDKIILAKNSDFLVDIEKLCDSAYYNLDNTFSFVANTTAWIEMEDGINEHGLAAALTFIYPTKLGYGLNAGMLVRLILETCKTVREAVEVLRHTPIASSQTITLADKTGDMAVIECNCDKVVEKKQIIKNAVFITNHFVSEEMLKYQTDMEDTIHSYERYETLKNALSKNKNQDAIEFTKDLLSGKLGFLCQYDRKKGMDTVWSSIYSLTDKKIYIAEGNPSRKKFREDKRLKFL